MKTNKTTERTGKARHGYEYLISGYDANGIICLVMHGFKDIQEAKRALDRMIHCPTKNDLFLIKGLHDLFIEEAKSRDMWWSDSGLCN